MSLDIHLLKDKISHIAKTVANEMGYTAKVVSYISDERLEDIGYEKVTQFCPFLCQNSTIFADTP